MPPFVDEEEEEEEDEEEDGSEAEEAPSPQGGSLLRNCVKI